MKVDSNTKAERILEGVAAWCGFYRCNPHRFVKDYLNITLKLFQKILIYAMMINDHFMYIASRGQGKTWLTALFCVVRCILFPKTKICISSCTRSQANEVLQKITEDFMKNHTWGSENLKREIESYTIGQNKAEIKFQNGSWIKVVTSSDSGRGARANIVIIDEFRMVDKDTINTVIKRFLASPRQPEYLNNPKYAHLIERNKEIYMSSAWYKTHWSYDKARAYTLNFFNESKNYFICGLPYQVSIKENLLVRADVEDEMSETDFDQVKFYMEMECLWYGEDANGNFFPFDPISEQRKIDYPIFYKIKGIKYNVPDLLPNEHRVLSADIALMSSDKRNNDAASLIVNRAYPEGRGLKSHIVYLENHEGLRTEVLALQIRKLFDYFKCTELVIDTAGSGLGVYDAIANDIYDPDNGKLYPALSCINDESMAERCVVPNAPKVIYSIKANPGLNDEVCTTLRNGLLNGNIDLLVSEYEADELLKDKFPKFSQMPIYQQQNLKMPYIDTTLLIYELIKLKNKIINNKNHVYEVNGARKDRYSSLAYNYYVVYEYLEKNYKKEINRKFDPQSFARELRKLNKRPKMY